MTLMTMAARGHRARGPLTALLRGPRAVPPVAERDLSCPPIRPRARENAQERTPDSTSSAPPSPSSATSPSSSPCSWQSSAHGVRASSFLPCSPAMSRGGASSAGPGADAGAGAGPSVPQAFRREKMLEMLRHVPMPVVVVTAAAPPAGQEDEHRQHSHSHSHSPAAPLSEDELVMRGLTCSSFCSISLEPPLVSVCIHRDSPFLPLVSRTPVFALHLLHQGNKDLSNRFAQKHPDLTKATFGSHAAVEWELYRPKDGVEVTVGTHCYVPVLKGTQAVLVCLRMGLHSFGDHKMLVGEVMSHAARDGEPLIYMNREYWQLGGKV